MTRTDADNYVSERNAKFIKEALGDAVRIITVTEDTSLGFIDCINDVVIAQTRNRTVLDSIIRTGVANTVESKDTVLLTKDKEIVKRTIERAGLKSAKTIKRTDVIEEGKTYFVKPKFGEDSNGVDERSKCSTAKQIQQKCEELKAMGYEPIVEEYIDGEECTAAVLRHGNRISVYPIKVNIPTEFVTHEVKFSEDEICEPLGERYCQEIEKVFKEICYDGHYMRIDFRIKDEEVYIIDFNLFPGLGPIDHFAKCLSLNENKSYRDVLLAIANTADRKAKPTNPTV